MPWATEADVVALTGTPADAVKLAQAQGLIELAISRTEAMGTAEMTLRDLDWLKKAVAYQAAWIAGQPDLFTRLDVESLSQDGMSAKFSSTGSLVYAPLATRAMRNLSWRGSSRSVSVEPFVPTPRRRYPVGGAVIDYENEQWKPLSPWNR
jgi:hypothetical protein